MNPDTCHTCGYYDCTCDNPSPIDRRIAIRKRVVDLYTGIMVAKEAGDQNEWLYLRTACYDAFGKKIPKTKNNIDEITDYLVNAGFIP